MPNKIYVNVKSELKKNIFEILKTFIIRVNTVHNLSIKQQKSGNKEA